MKSVLPILISGILAIAAQAAPLPSEASGVASWYGEEHRGRLMANRQPFDPDKLAAASWFYPLGTRVRVTLKSTRPEETSPSVVVVVTDRGPAKYLVRKGRKIDLSAAAFAQLAQRDLGLVEVTIVPVPD